MNMKIPPATWIEVDNNWHATLSAWRYDRLRGPIRQAWARENVGLWAPGHTPLNSTPPLVPAKSGIQEIVTDSRQRLDSRFAR